MDHGFLRQRMPRKPVMASAEVELVNKDRAAYAARAVGQGSRRLGERL